MSDVASHERETFDIEGIETFSARRGTSTHVLAGAAKYWQDKYKGLESDIVSARRTGFLGGLVFAALTILVSYAVWHLIKG